MAEELAGFLSKIEIKSKYIHSDVDTLERVKIMQGLREDELMYLLGLICQEKVWIYQKYH